MGGEYSNTAALSEYLSHTIKIYKTHFSENEKSIMLLECLQEEINKAVLGKDLINRSLRREIAEDYQKFVLGTTYFIDLRELLAGSDHAEFRGAFHVHHDGSKPSSADIYNNKVLFIPSLVISATPEYNDEGISLYLIHGGDTELLYQGFLPPKTER